MLSWIIIILLFTLILRECENIICNDYKSHDEFHTKSCRLDEDEDADDPSCEMDTILINFYNLEEEKLNVHFNLLSKACNITTYKFRMDMAPHVHGTVCNGSDFGNGLIERNVIINDTVNQGCGKTQNVIFENMVEGCYELLTYVGINNNFSSRSTVFYHHINASVHKHDHKQYININNNTRENGVVSIKMDNFSQFKLVHSRITMPKGDWICNGNTTNSIPQFTWNISRDRSDQILCKTEARERQIECRLDKTQTIDCIIHNLSSGNYCYYMTATSDIKERKFYSNFSVLPRMSDFGSYEDWNFYIIVPSGCLCFIVVFFIVIMIICRKTHSFLVPVNNRRWQPSSQKSGILLLYSRDCKPFMEMMTTFRKILKEITKCQVYDCFDPNQSEEVGRNKFDWMRHHISSNDIKIVVVESACAVAHQQALLNGIAVCYSEPTWLDDLFAHGLKVLTDDLNRNTYQNVCVVRISGFTQEMDTLSYLTPYRRFVVPIHLEKLLNYLNMKRNLHIVTDFDESISTGVNFQKFQEDLKNLVNHKRQEPGYLNKFLQMSDRSQCDD